MSVPPSHPALPGHFPGQPVVPGVVLLEAVLAAAEAWQQRALEPLALPTVKFLQPLLPGQDAEIVLEAVDGALRFQVLRGTDLLAQGTLELAP